MSAGDVVMLAYVLAVVGLIAVAIAVAIWYSLPLSEPSLQTSLDCRDGKHSACLACDGCSCPSSVLR